MKNKFNPILVKKNTLDNKEKKHQDELKKIHGIEDEKVVVVEKNNFIKYFIRLFSSVFKDIVSITLIILAFIGLVSIIFPAPRADIIDIFSSALTEMKSFFE